MATTFSLFFLGTAPEIDTVEGNLTSENHVTLNGLVFGGVGSEIANNVQDLSPIDYSGGDAASYDADNLTSNDTFAIDGGAAQTHDVTMLYSNTLITYTDGSTATVEAIVMQDTSGNTYLLPPTTGPSAYSDALEAKPIESVTLGTAVPSGGTNVYGMTADRYDLAFANTDTDGDGVLDSVDVDDDGDGILDTDEGYSETTPTTITITFDGDEFAAGDNTRWVLRDPDGNIIAADSTNDTTVQITNVPVAGLGDYSFIIRDDFGDGLSGTDPASYTIAIDGVIVLDSGSNPNFGTSITETFTVQTTVTTTDTDGDGIADHLDLDSDNDGITDNVEAQTTDGYIAPTGVDTDGDGLDDAYETGGLTPVDTDSDGTADVLDTDSDNDGIADVNEAGHGVSQATIDASGDADGDGIMDAVDDVVGFDVNDADIDGSGNFTLADTDNDTAPDGSGAIPLVNDLDFRDADTNSDSDGDGINDDVDIDDDGDGILDTDEGYSEATPTTITITFDGDSFAPVETSWELRDASGTLIANDSTILETIEITDVGVTDLGDYTFTVFDTFGDGMQDGTGPASYQVAIDGVTVIDSGPSPNFGTDTSHVFNVDTVVTTTDTDGDGIADHLDLDSDNDGITDNVEAQTTDGYIAPTGVDTDGDGLDDAYETGGLTPVDTDSDGTADVLDTDSDNDGIADVNEAGHGISQAAIDASGDADGDGIKDVVDDVVGFDANDADIDGSGNFALADTDFDTPPDGSGATPMIADLDFRDAVPCFAPGTLIDTLDGPRAVETLTPGDLVETLDHGPQPVLWVRQGDQPLEEVEKDSKPVLIAAGALGSGLPAHDLIVSPQHRIIVGGGGQLQNRFKSEAFAPAKSLTSLRGIRHMAGKRQITWIHFACEAHEVVTANGCLSESLLLGPMVLNGLTGTERQTLTEIFGSATAPGVALNGLPARECLTVGAVRRQLKKTEHKKSHRLAKDSRKWDEGSAMDQYETERMRDAKSNNQTHNRALGAA